MQIIRTDTFKRHYKKLPHQIKEQAQKQLNLLIENPQHPSLRVKKTKGQTEEIFEARVSRGYRFTFKIEGEYYILRKIGTHDILRAP